MKITNEEPLVVHLQGGQTLYLEAKKWASTYSNAFDVVNDGPVGIPGIEGVYLEPDSRGEVWEDAKRGPVFVPWSAIAFIAAGPAPRGET